MFVTYLLLFFIYLLVFQETNNTNNSVALTVKGKDFEIFVPEANIVQW